jgi:hypothetical protein
MLKRLVLMIEIILLSFVAFCGWWWIASNYDYAALSGTYIFTGSGQSSTLVLKSDSTFQQELRHGNVTDHATGTWRRFGEGGVVFAGGFLRLPGQRSYADSAGSDAASPRHPEFYGHFEKILTVYPKLSLDGGDKEVVLHKRLFH